MKAKDLRKLATNPEFIPGIYNYCDRWCERCPLSERCLNRAIELAEDDGDPAAQDLSNWKFWDRLHGKFRDTLEMVRADARARGIDLDDPKREAERKIQERAERRRTVKNRPLTRAATAYVKAADKWFESARPAFATKGIELETLARLGAGRPRTEAAALMEYVDVIRWYQHFICVKLCRAIESRANEEFETDEELKSFPKDSDGSAKIALIAMDRSLGAWAGLRETLGDDPDDVLDLLAQLAAIRRETEKLFPEARAFVRPGFDEPGAVPAGA